MSKPSAFHKDPLARITPGFLEEIEGEAALRWVRERNKRTEEALGSPPKGFPSVQDLEAELLSVLDNPGRIPMVTVRGDWAYNFWTDDTNPRGLWRRMPLSDYLNQEEAWEVLLDVDALARTEGKSWVWHGAQVCPPEYTKALITLSNGGSDADETREFSLETLDWVEGGFYRPEGKGSLRWLTPDLCWLSQPTGPESTSASGYPLEARLLKRGQSLSDSELILAGDPSAMGVWAGVVRDRSGTHSVLQVSHDFYTSDTYLVDGDPENYGPKSPALVPVPQTSEVFIWNQWVGVWLREVWDRNGQTYPSGSLLGFRAHELLSNPGEADASVLFRPTSNEVLEAVTTTADHIVLTTIQDVVSSVTVLDPPRDASENRWTSKNLPLPKTPSSKDIATVSVTAVRAAHDNRLWMVTTGYSEPSTLWMLDLDTDSKAALVRQAPALYETGSIEVQQHFAVSEDGTRIPYFEVRNVNAPLPAPTLVYGYGGFNVSLLPAYAPTVGKAWLERGGVYVVANIRGGGEYGPDWHKAALKERRHKAYEDFVAIAADLRRRGITTRRQVGAQGGSNGGLLMGNMYTQFPNEFGAILCQVPLLDMGRYHTLLAGHSWVAEYGDPTDPQQWQFIQTFSPVHLFDEGQEYPPLMITTSTKDDRVHPGHARSLGYLAEEAGKSVLYFENIEGGHGGAADNRQRAHNQALGWAFLWKELSSPEDSADPTSDISEAAETD